MRFIHAVGLLCTVTTAVGAQAYDPHTQSPLKLLAVPANGVEYRDDVLRARELVVASKFSEAEPLVERITREYPRDGENWILLARTKRALAKHAEAAAAYERAGPLLGWGLFYNARIYAAASELAAGNKQGALALLHQEIMGNRSLMRDALYNWPEFAALRDDAEFKTLVGRPDVSTLNRNAGWAFDVDFLYDEVRRTNPDYQGRALPEEFTRRRDDLKKNIPNLTDAQIFVGMSRMLGALHQGHVSMFETGPGLKQLPLVFHAFPEGIFVIDAVKGHEDVVGARLVAIEGTPAEEALRRIAESLSVDGDMQFLSTGVYWLPHAQYLAGLGIARSVDSIRVTLERPDGSPSEMMLATVPAIGWAKMVAPKGVTAPLYLEHVKQTHWAKVLPEEDALYMQVNNLSNSRDESLAAFGRRMWGLLAPGGPKNLIIDLRHNNGGTTDYYPELMRSIIAHNRVAGNRLYVLMGRYSYSATANFIADLERLANPVFVGEASAECCNFHGDASHLMLPYSKLEAELTTVRWNLSRNAYDGRREMSPHVPVQQTAKSYFAGEDPALQAVFTMIRK